MCGNESAKKAQHMAEAANASPTKNYIKLQRVDITSRDKIVHSPVTYTLA